MGARESRVRERKVLPNSEVTSWRGSEIACADQSCCLCADRWRAARCSSAAHRDLALGACQLCAAAGIAKSMPLWSLGREQRASLQTMQRRSLTTRRVHHRDSHQIRRGHQARVSLKRAALLPWPLMYKHVSGSRRRSRGDPFGRSS